jgi:hypothetical protein
MRQSAVRVHLGGWSIEIPDEWDHSFEEGNLQLSRPNKSSVLEFSSIGKTDGSEMSDEDLCEFIDELGLTEATRFPASYGPFAGYHLHHDAEGDEALQYWVLASGPMMLLVQYRCDQESSGLEDADIHETLSSMQLDQDRGLDS